MVLKATKKHSHIVNLDDEEIYVNSIRACRSYYGIHDHVPKEKMTEKLYATAVEKGFYHIPNSYNQYITGYIVPDEFLTKPIFIASVKYKSDNIRYVPEEFRDHDVCLEAAKTSKFSSIVDPCIMWIPHKYRTSEVLAECSKHYGTLIHYFDETLITKEICIIAVEQNGIAIQYVPEKYKTDPLIIMAALYQKGIALQYIHTDLITKPMCIMAINQDGMALKYVPEKYKTYDLCLDAVKKNPLAIQFVPSDLKKIELCMVAIKNSITIKFMLDKEYYADVAKSNLDSIRFIPYKFIDPDLHGEYWNYVDELRHYGLCDMHHRIYKRSAF